MTGLASATKIFIITTELAEITTPPDLRKLKKKIERVAQTVNNKYKTKLLLIPRCGGMLCQIAFDNYYIMGSPS